MLITTYYLVHTDFFPVFWVKNDIDLMFDPVRFIFWIKIRPFWSSLKFGMDYSKQSRNVRFRFFGPPFFILTPTKNP